MGVVLALLLRYMETHNSEYHPPQGSEEQTVRELLVEKYSVSSVAPTIVLALAAYYSLFRRTYGLRVWTKILFSVQFFIELAAIFVYQYYEIYYLTKDRPYIILIVIPRTIYMLTLLSSVYLFASLCSPSLLYHERPASKPMRISSFYTLLIMSILPSLLIIAGPYQQILFVFCLILAFGSVYCLNGTILMNSCLQFTVYGIAAFKLFYASGHRLDFLSPKIARTFVGFPEFDMIITFSISIVDFATMIMFLIMLLPLATIAAHELSPTEPQGEQAARNPLADMQPMPLDTDQSQKSVSGNNLEESRAVVSILRNYVIMLLYFDIIQDALSRFLVFNFEERFFQASHTEFTFRFINWMTYGVICLNTFATGKA
ncbi:MAG: hypothetical protein P4M11_04000 [Candidatus Pacebacteria bacterium]|nr:hypothetical protein [Candidatus Paceibacterota bacterium]